ncbi:hypothetical protein AMJ82_08820 [candidate division TA06 bacterium SM23_40]|jgi:ubiquinone/menaquinone biosynthesis C-methylase UbiE|nr:MAG: hypothetical protein AMJ82_08820 [candidate division TA06 bacterium SM23_40]
MSQTGRPSWYVRYYDDIASRRYDLLAKLWFIPQGGQGRARRALVDVIELKRGDRILDMCCGTGGATFVIAEKLGEKSKITGIDLSGGQIRVANGKNSHPNVDFMVMDASKTDFRDGEFDRVVIPHALHEMWRDGRLAVLREARRILRDGGSVAVLELDRPPGRLMRLFVALWWFYWLPFNFETPTRRDMVRYGVADEVREAGFRDVTKVSLFRGALQAVQGCKEASIRGGVP